ncbi:hypothetical protein [Natronococcus jeotgali]|uniref:Uncharacterized protein n=1 Tax=Natronococcus jeotgali DSM 18795 TaxID=1227498 RepID=L9WTJ6_9EURY|nr:hypothetical protein [Natronococcus jeotgali]ELY52775.1 hypothetical protein C492_19112 [Natronococcus jeotgali DSM 18795]
MRIGKGSVQLFAETEDDLELINQLKEEIKNGKYEKEHQSYPPTVQDRGDTGIIISQPISIELDSDTEITVPNKGYIQSDYPLTED